MGDFSARVYQAVSQIPAGKVATYGHVARMIGSPRSARFVGYALHANPRPGTDPDAIPCHRVVFKDGSISPGFAFGGKEAQRALLEAEGVRFLDDIHVDLAHHLWNGITNDIP